MKINCIIVDDEPLALDVLEQYISLIPELHITARCNNALEAREALSNHQIDLVFVDVHMPEISGIEFIKSLESPPLIIITTAHPDYAVEGFNLDVTDYLLKPISFERFMKSARKSVEQILLKKSQHGRIHDDDDFFFVKADQKLIKLKFDEIQFVEALADYVKIHTSEKRIVTLHTMKKMEEKLPSDLFIRVHRSYIVGIKRIRAVSGNKIEIGHDQKIPIGKNYKSSLYSFLNTNNVIN